jgi:hypothetical protein
LATSRFAYLQAVGHRADREPVKGFAMPSRVRTTLVIGWFALALMAYVVARRAGWQSLTKGPRPLIFLIVGLPFLLIAWATEGYFDTRQRATARKNKSATYAFRVLLPDRSHEDWGGNSAATYVVEETGCLRVLIPGSDSATASTAQTAKLYQPDEWLEVERLLA